MRKLLPVLFFPVVLFVVSVNPVFAKKHHRHHQKTTPTEAQVQPVVLHTDSVRADSLISFAKTLLNTPYRAASSDPLRGFDCSGFVSFVFKSFNVNVPRSSCEFTGVGETIDLADAKPGDVVLFTGTPSHHPHSVGHVGIVYSNDNGELKFIHSTSGKEYCVTISSMAEENYQRRFVKAVRLLKQNDDVVLAAR